MADLVAWLLPSTEENLLGKNLASLRMAREEALKGHSSETRKLIAWFCWSKQDPQVALTAALAIPTTETPAISVTSCDFPPGYLIGELGSDSEVIERLRGAYSDQLANGVSCGLRKRDRPGMAEVVAARLERIAEPRFGMLCYLTELHPELACRIFRGYADQPTPANLSRLWGAAHIDWRFDKDRELQKHMLQSGNVEARKIALSVFVRWRNPEPGWFLAVLPSAEGRHPNSDADEQRLAAGCLEQLRGPDTVHVYWDGNKAQPGSPVLPLKPEENAALRTLCALAREKLGLPPAKPSPGDSSDEPEPQEENRANR
jgi:hypothetical protein